MRKVKDMSALNLFDLLGCQPIEKVFHFAVVAPQLLKSVNVKVFQCTFGLVKVPHKYICS